MIGGCGAGGAGGGGGGASDGGSGMKKGGRRVIGGGGGGGGSGKRTSGGIWKDGGMWINVGLNCFLACFIDTCCPCRVMWSFTLRICLTVSASSNVIIKYFSFFRICNGVC